MSRRDWLTLALTLFAGLAMGCGKSEDRDESDERPLPPNRLPPEPKPKPTKS